MSPQDIAQLQQWSDHRDPEAFQDLVNRYAGLVYAACMRVLGNDHDAQDVTQECFLHLAEAPRDVDTSLAGWLHTVATRRAINRIRADSRRRARESAYEADRVETVEPSLNDLHQHVDEAIADLPHDLKYAIVEHYLAGRTYDDIATELGITRQAVSQRAQKGVERVRTQLAQKGVIAGAAVLLVALEDLTVSAVPLSVLRTLGNLAVAGFPAPAATGSWLVAASAGAIIVILGAIVALQPDSAGSSSPPPQQSNPPVAAALASPDRDAGREPLRLAQSTETGAEPAATTAATPQSDHAGTERAPDFTKFSLDRPFPEPGVGAMSLVVKGEEVDGTEVTIRYINWHPWEETPTSMLTYRKTVGPDGYANFKNLPYGPYHIDVQAKSGTTGVQYYCTINELGSGRWWGNMPLWPITAKTFNIVDEDGNPVPDATINVYQYPNLPGGVPFHLNPFMPMHQNADGSYTVDRSAATPWKAWVDAPGYAPTVADYPITAKNGSTIVLGHGGSIDCRVVDDETGEPLPEVIVFALGDFHRANAHAWTNNDGLARIENLREGEYRVNVYARDVVLRSEPIRVAVTDGDSTDAGELRAGPGALIRGRVFDENTGAGLSGLRMTVRTNLGYAIDYIETDEDGFYEVPNAANGEYTVFRPITLEYPIPAGETLRRIRVAQGAVQGDTDFALHKGATVELRVTDRDGRPIPGAQVRAGAVHNQLSNQGFTDRAGRFRLTVEPGAAQVAVELGASTYARENFGYFAVQDVLQSGIDLTMRPMASIGGTRYRNGAPIWGQGRITVTRRKPSDDDHGPFVTSVPTGVVRGGYLVQELLPGTYDVALRPPGAAESGILATVTLEEGENLGDFDIYYHTSGLSLTGNLVDPAGAGIESAQVIVRSRPGSSEHVSLAVDTMAGGRFSLSGLPDGVYDLTASHKDFSTTTLTGVEAGSTDVRIQLDPLAQLSGTVRASDSRAPITAFQIAGSRGDNHLPYQDLNGVYFNSPDGRYTYSRLHTGTNTVYFIAPGYATERVVLDAIRPGEHVQNFDVLLQNAPVLAGTVVDVHGNPVHGARVYAGPDASIYWELDFAQSVAVTSASGQFESDRAPLNTRHVSVVHPDFAPHVVDVELLPGIRTEFTATLTGGATVSGLVLGANFERGYVRLFNVQQQHQITAELDELGQFTLERIPAGDYMVQASIYANPVNRSLDPFPIALAGTEDLLLDLEFRSDYRPATLTGTVTRDNEPEPVVFLRLETDGELFSTVTQNSGTYVLSHLPPGIWQLRIIDQRSNLVSTTPIEIAEGETLEFNPTL